MSISSNAKSARITADVSAETVKKEEEVKVKLTVSSDSSMSTVEAMITYDPNSWNLLDATVMR